MRLGKFIFVIVLAAMLYSPGMAYEAGPLVDSLEVVEFDLLWERYVGLTTFRTTIQFYEGKIFIGSNGESYAKRRDRWDGVYILDPSDGEIIKQIRRYRTGDRDVNGIAINDEYFYFGNDNNTVFCYNHKYRPIWEFSTDGDIEGAPVLADFNRDGTEDVCFATEAGEVYAVDGITGEEIWKFQAKHDPGEWEWPESKSFIASPALYDVNGDGVGDVLIGSRNGNFYALTERKGMCCGNSGRWCHQEFTRPRSYASEMVNRSFIWRSVIQSYTCSTLMGMKYGAMSLGIRNAVLRGFFRVRLYAPMGHWQ